MGNLAICADRDSLIHCETLGLEGVDLQSASWVDLYDDANEARRGVSKDRPEEAWISTVEDFDSINIASAIHQDSPTLPLYIISSKPSGSMLSRATCAGVSGILDGVALERRFRMLEMQQSNIEHEVGIGKRDSSAKATRVDKDAGHGGAFTISFIGAGGGCGRSAIAAVASELLARSGFKVAALDLDLQFGDLRVLMGLKDAPTVDEALADESLVGILAEKAPPKRPCLISAPKRLEQSEVLADKAHLLIDACSSAFDFVVINTGACWSEMSARLLEDCSSSVFVLGQSSSSIRACRHALSLCSSMGIASTPFSFALNRCSRHSIFSPEDVSAALGQARVIGLQDGGEEVEGFLGSGLSSELVKSGNVLVGSVSDMLNRIIPDFKCANKTLDPYEQEPSTPSHRGGIFKSGKKRGRQKAARKVPEIEIDRGIPFDGSRRILGPLK